MTRKAVFLDVDVTLVNHRGIVPDSARDAVRQARANGHRVFLSTGRSMSEIWPELVDIGFDGYIAGAGAYVECDEQVLVHHHLTDEQVRHVTTYFDARGVEYFLESNDGLYGSPGVQAKLAELIYGPVTDPNVLAELEHGLGGFIDAIRVDADPLQTRINKVSFLDSDTTADQIRAEFAPAFDVIATTVPMFGPNSGEMSQAGIHKAGGIELLCDHLGIDRADTLAIGDGLNDLEMLAHVAVGIAMGDAPQAVKDVADDVTGTADAHGLHTAFVRHGLLDRTPAPAEATVPVR
jgi:Cof subfamily protein (haloacid dehalogenase superfamily)